MVFTNPTYPSSLQRDFQGVLIRYSSYNRVLNSTFDHWGRYQNGDQEGNHIRIIGDLTRGIYNLIEGNTFTYGAQGCILVNGSYNIIRNNIFNNEWQKGIYVGWFVNPGDEPPGTEWVAAHNLIEGNQFIRTGMSQYQHGGMAYEETAVGSIFRRNIIHDMAYAGMQITVFGDHAQFDHHNRWYNNTIVYNGQSRTNYGGVAIEISNWGMGLELHHNVFKNNIAWGNLPNASNHPFQLSIDVSGSSNAPPLAGFVVAGNLFENPRASNCTQNLRYNNGYGECPIYVNGIADGDSAWFNSRYANNFWGNVEGNPNFVTYNPSGGSYDLRLRAGSPAIDAGVDLTYTVGAGSGNVITVEDAWYFHDGYGGMIAPDSLRVGSETVTIVSINYDTNQITVDRAISWGARTPVNLPFNGSRPDIGVYESVSVGMLPEALLPATLTTGQGDPFGLPTDWLNIGQVNRAAELPQQ